MKFTTIEIGFDPMKSDETKKTTDSPTRPKEEEESGADRRLHGAGRPLEATLQEEEER